MRSVRSLIQTCGRASRNANGCVIMYADKMTESMQVTINITEKRRQKQEAYNKQHGVVPKTIYRKISPSLAPIELDEMIEFAEEKPVYQTVTNLEDKIKELEQEMQEAAEILNFESAAELRDRINELRGQLVKG